MKLASLVFPALFVMVAACGGGDDGGSGDDDDDDPGVDAAAATVVEVDCAGATIAETVTTSGFAYSPTSVTISVGEVVQFTPASSHDVNGDGWDVGFGETACMRFDAAGTFDFFCTPHDFDGSVVVQ